MKTERINELMYPRGQSVIDKKQMLWEAMVLKRLPGALNRIPPGYGYLDISYILQMIAHDIEIYVEEDNSIDDGGKL